jgi:TolB-like protein
MMGCGSSKPPAPPAKIPVSVSEFEARTGVQPGEAQLVSDAFSALVQNSGRFTVVERNQLKAVLQEQGFQDQQQGAQRETGTTIAIRKMITGSIGKLGDNFIFTLRMTDVESASVDLLLTRTYDDDLEDINEKFLPSVLQEVLDTLDGKPKRKE